jgi:hypothetical protein
MGWDITTRQPELEEGQTTPLRQLSVTHRCPAPAVPNAERV